MMTTMVLKKIGVWLSLAVVVVSLLVLCYSSNNDQLPSLFRRPARHLKTSKIMGGMAVTSTSQFPFFAYWDVGCGATLVAPDLLLSAAHCYIDEGRTDDRGRVYLGDLDYLEGHAYDVIDVMVHPRFNGDYYYEPEYDFMLLRINDTIPDSIATPVKLNDNPLVPSATGSYGFGADQLTVIGFGSLDEKEKEWPDVLQQVTIPYLDTPTCQGMWGDSSIDEWELCTLYEPGGMDSCYGDSGGPLLMMDVLQGEWVQVGIVSWGDGCGQSDAPAVAARVSAATEKWIRPKVCMTSAAPPASCQEHSADLPLSLRVDILSSGTIPWQIQNISWGLYQLYPPMTIYEVDESGQVHSNLLPPLPPVQNPGFIALTRAASSRKKDKDKKKEDKEEEEEIEEAALLAAEAAEELYTSLYFDNLPATLFYFRIQQSSQDMTEKGTLGHYRVVQGYNFTDRFWLEHAWVDVEGSQFVGFDDQYIDLTSTRPFSEISLPATDPTPLQLRTTNLTVDVFYDALANETAWEVRNMVNNTIITIVRQGTVTTSGLRSYLMEVPVATPLQFRIWDQAHNGMNNPNGWVELWNAARRQRIWAFDGSMFTAEYNVQFQVE